VGKGSKMRPCEVERKVFEDNWDRIYGKTKEKRPREPERQQHIESYNFVEWKPTYFQEGCVRYAEYSIQYHAPTTNN